MSPWTKGRRHTAGCLQQGRYRRILRSSLKDNFEGVTFCRCELRAKHLHFSNDRDMTYLRDLAWAALGAISTFSPIGVYPRRYYYFSYPGIWSITPPLLSARERILVLTSQRFWEIFLQLLRYWAAAIPDQLRRRFLCLGTVVC